MTSVEFEAKPTIVLLYSVGDKTVDWLGVGAALQRVWLTATVRGLAATPLTQVTEIPQLRALLADSATNRWVQSVLRIGYPTTETAATPRRPLAEVIVADASRQDGQVRSLVGPRTDSGRCSARSVPSAFPPDIDDLYR